MRALNEQETSTPMRAMWVMNEQKTSTPMKAMNDVNPYEGYKRNKKLQLLYEL